MKLAQLGFKPEPGKPTLEPGRHWPVSMGIAVQGNPPGQRLGIAIPDRAEDVADRRGGAILKHDIPRGVLQDVGIFIFVLPRGIDQLQAVAIANGNGGRAPEVGGAVCALGDIVDQHLQRGAVPAVTVTVIHRQGVCAALRVRGDVPHKEQQQRKDGDEFSHGFKSALCTLFGGVNSIGRGSPVMQLRDSRGEWQNCWRVGKCSRC